MLPQAKIGWRKQELDEGDAGGYGRGLHGYGEEREEMSEGGKGEAKS